jgi:hypothetical protein
VDSESTKWLPKRVTSNTQDHSYPLTSTMSYSVRIRRFGDEKFTIGHKGDVNCGAALNVSDLLAGILSDLQAGRTNVTGVTEITVTVKKREHGPVTPATE